MTNFTAIDILGSLLAVIVFAAVLYGPGFVVGYAADLFGFRTMGRAERSLWAIVLSFGVMPYVAYALGRALGLNAVCWMLAAAAVLSAGTMFAGRRPAVWSLRERWIAFGAVGAWTLFVVASLVDVQVGGRLYFSVVEFDQSYRVAFTDAVLRTGVPPANPLYFTGQPGAMRYYYFWYVVCALGEKLGHVSARQAFVGSSVWAGFGLAAMVGLFVRHFLGAVRVRRDTLIGLGLLAVTGAGLLPAIGSLFGQTALNGEMEWWSIDHFSSWQDCLLWVPHHTASLLCCLLSFLLLWRTQEGADGKDRTCAVCLAGVAFASSVGLSIYVAFGFALLMLAWVARLMLQGELKLARRVAAAGVVGAVVLLPFLMELTGDRSGTQSGATANAGHVFAFSIRRMIDPQLLAGLPVFAGLNHTHPVLLDGALRLLLLLPGLALELGFYGAVFVLLLLARRREGSRSPARETALFLAGCGLLMVVFIRSAVINNNDFGYRAAMLPQFFLLLLGTELLSDWRSAEGKTGVPRTLWSSRLVYALMALGFAGTVYQGVMLRAFLPFEQRMAGHGFEQMPERVFEARRALAALDKVASRSAVLEFNPIDPRPGTRGDVVSPYEFYSRSVLMNSGRQMLSAEPVCALQFGGSAGPCAAIERDTAQLYALPAPSAEWAKEYCARFQVSYLALSDLDPAWADGAGWGARLPQLASEPRFRIVSCGR